MGLTMAERILASHSGKSRVSPGKFVEAIAFVAISITLIPVGLLPGRTREKWKSKELVL